MWIKVNFYNGEVVDLLSWEIAKDEDTSTEQEIYYNRMGAEPYPTGTLLLHQSSVNSFDWLNICTYEKLFVFFPLEFREICRVN